MSKYNTIVILCHERAHPYLIRKYQISHMARYWRKCGYQVKFLRGISEFVPAQVCIVHVDLSVVPESYLKFANQYPATVNGKISDIRKSVVSQAILGIDESYQGQVIVKTDLNYAGLPEKVLKSSIFRLAISKIKKYCSLQDSQLPRQSSYIVYENKDNVPESVRQNPDFVIEKFNPNREGSQFSIRFFKCFGSNYECTKNFSNEPIITSFNTTKREAVIPHKAILEYRQKIGLDFGKIDYFMDGDQPVVIDVNKTPGTTGGKLTQSYLSQIHSRADAIQDWF